MEVGLDEIQLKFKEAVPEEKKSGPNASMVERKPLVKSIDLHADLTPTRVDPYPEYIKLRQALKAISLP